MLDMPEFWAAVDGISVCILGQTGCLAGQKSLHALLPNPVYFEAGRVFCTVILWYELVTTLPAPPLYCPSLGPQNAKQQLVGWMNVSTQYFPRLAAASDATFITNRSRLCFCL